MNRNSKKGLVYNFKNNKYFVTEKNNVHYFIKPRGIHYKNGLSERTLDLANSYGIDMIDFSKSDLIVDVGANTGDLISYFPNQRYIGFEPSPAEFKCLQENSKSNCTVYNYAAGDTDNEIDFYISSAGADSSMFMPLKVENIVRVKQIRLDKLINSSVKLLKIDAEGAEFEVINGARNLLSKIEFIAIDLGFEKGINQESTAPVVFNYLYGQDFELIKIQRNERYMFKNRKLNTFIV